MPTTNSLFCESDCSVTNWLGSRYQNRYCSGCIFLGQINEFDAYFHRGSRTKSNVYILRYDHGIRDFLCRFDNSAIQKTIVEAYGGNGDTNDPYVLERITCIFLFASVIGASLAGPTPHHLLLDRME